MNAEQRLIVIDWGTSNFRAFLVDRQSGACLESRRSEAGLKALETAEFPHYCQAQVGDWREGGRVPVYLAGMVGSKRGWSEAPQLDLPVSGRDLAAHVVAAPGLENTWIVPGVKHVDDAHCDVMRGEEVQAFGALALSGTPNADCCLPGTHSKWARLHDNRLTAFTTLMTGELYHTVRFHTLPGEPARDDSPFDEGAFHQGLARAHSEDGVLHALFEARSRHLYRGLYAEQVGSFISGVLIGEEVRAMRAARPDLERLLLIGAEALRRPYTLALETAGLEVTPLDSDAATLAGLAVIAEHHHAE